MTVPFSLQSFPSSFSCALMFQHSRVPSVLHLLINTIFPTPCAVCEKPLRDDPIPFFCRSCWNMLRPISGPCCPKCGRPFPSPVALRFSPLHRCGPCRRRPLAFTQAWSLYSYASPMKEAIGLFKYQKKLSLQKTLTRALIQALPDLPPVDGIMAVPLHPSRLRHREYNQSSLLAYRLSQHLHLPIYFSCLVRTRSTPPQTTLKKKARLTNLRRAFSVTTPHRITNKRILLVDDVLTTGATLHECAKTLRRAGSGHVYGLTLARMV